MNVDLNLENYNSSIEQPIDKLIKLLSSSQNTRFKLKKLVVTQDIYPKIENVGITDNRERTTFSFPYVTNREERNSQDYLPLFEAGNELKNINSLEYEGK